MVVETYYLLTYYTIILLKRMVVVCVKPWKMQGAQLNRTFKCYEPQKINLSLILTPYLNKKYICYSLFFLRYLFEIFLDCSSPF